MNEHTVLVYTNPLAKAFWESDFLFPIGAAAFSFIALVVVLTWAVGELMTKIKILRTYRSRNMVTWAILAVSAMTSLFIANKLVI